MTRAATLHLLIGPVGAGKSTFARRRAAETASLFLDLDEWMVRLYGADPRPREDVVAWYLERRERCRGVLWDVALDAVRGGVDVYLEAGLVTAAERADAYRRVGDEALPLAVTMVDAPRDVRRARVLARNERGGPAVQVVPLPFFERASDAWEPPTEAERAAWAIVDA